jgi:putative membrane protein
LVDPLASEGRGSSDVAWILPDIQVDSFGAAFIAALVIGLVGATVGLILKLILLPFIILTLGGVYF